jgi:Uma2 family endonuclease
MSAATATRDQRFVLDGISWETYEALLADIGDRPVRLAYSRGRLEIMSPSMDHKWLKRLIGRLIEVLTMELGIPIKSCGSTTLKRRLLACGLEPDERYYIASEERVRGRKKIDPKSVPPPDLAIEIDITSSALNRLGIYASLRIPEIWHFKDEKLESLQLRRDGKYVPRHRSRAFPQIALSDIARFLARRGEMDETSLVLSFPRWVRRKFARQRPVP